MKIPKQEYTTDFHALHAVTPLGGFAFILGWLALALGIWRGSDE